MSYRRPDSFFSKGLLFRSVCLVMLIAIVYTLKLFTETSRADSQTVPKISVPFLTPEHGNKQISNFFKELDHRRSDS